MKKIIFIISIFCFSWADNLSKEKSYLEYIDVITTNDIHGFIAEQYADFINPQYPPKLGGGGALKKYIREYQSKLSNDLLIFDGGNFFQGNPLGVSDSGKSIIEWMNMIEYDALVPGASDFVYGAKNLNKLADIAIFPFLASNLNCNGCDLVSSNIKPYIINEISGVRIGILGIVDSDLNSKVLQKNINGISIDSEYDTINKWSSILKDSTDVLIILTSSGIPWDREIVYNNFLNSLDKGLDPSKVSLNAIEMGYFCNDVDLIISGGVSKGYDIPWYDKSSGVYTVQNYGNGTSFGHLKLVIHKPSNYFTGYELLVDNKLNQTLMQDDFDIDYEMNSWINSRYDAAIKLNNNTLFDYLDSSDKKGISNTQIITKDNSHLAKDNWDFPIFGSEHTMDIATWNCEFFPASDIETIEALAEAINDMNIDIIGFQEIKYRGWFDDLMDLIPEYDYVISNQSSFMDQALIFKKDSFRFIRQVEPFSDRDYNFAGRPPLRVDLQSKKNEDYISIINLHMKCCNSGLQRRKKASEMLYQYLSKEMDEGYSNFIVLGDWNDDLKDYSDEHCFNPFLDDNRFFFVTEKIVNDIYQASYPKEPYISFLDHILVTKKLIPGIDNYQHYDVMTIRLDHYMDSFSEYERLISDHFPVLLSFPW